MNVLITGQDFNKDDAVRCAAWLLGYLRCQAIEDGLTVLAKGPNGMPSRQEWPNPGKGLGRVTRPRPSSRP